MTEELKRALALADQILSNSNTDPDSTPAVLARQLQRTYDKNPNLVDWQKIAISHAKRIARFGAALSAYETNMATLRSLPIVTTEVVAVAIEAANKQAMQALYDDVPPPIEDEIREALTMFTSPTMGRGGVHGGQQGWIIYEGDGLPWLTQQLRVVFAGRTDQARELNEQLAELRDIIGELAARLPKVVAWYIPGTGIASFDKARPAPHTKLTDLAGRAEWQPLYARADDEHKISAGALQAIARGDHGDTDQVRELARETLMRMGILHQFTEVDPPAVPCGWLRHQPVDRGEVRTEYSHGRDHPGDGWGDAIALYDSPVIASPSATDLQS